MGTSSKTQATVLQLMRASFVLHLAHIASRSLPAHVALGDAYKELDSAADELAETAIGTGEDLLSPFSSFDYLAELDRSRVKVLALAEVSEDPALRALAEDIAGRISRQRFLLQQT